MSQMLSFRLTPEREKMLNKIKKRYKVKKNSEVIDLLLKMNTEKEPQYKQRIEQVAGCIRLEGTGDALTRIRQLREDLRPENSPNLFKLEGFFCEGLRNDP